MKKMNEMGQSDSLSKFANLPEFNRHPPPPLLEHADNAAQNRTLCFCNYGPPPACQFEDICVKHPKAACFHAVQQEFDYELGRVEVRHLFGCAPFERGSDGSHLTCNAWRHTHSSPRTIACCYEGNFCNRHLEVPEFPRLEPVGGNAGGKSIQYESTGQEALLFLGFGFLLGLCLLLTFALPAGILCRKGKAKKLVDRLHTRDGSTLEGGSLLLPNQPECTPNRFLLLEDSGSGSGGVRLNERTIALDLQMGEIFARGRYGELRKAVYRGSLVAVKIFHTTEEESWRNEREIYLSQMLNHENILQYVAADIMSSVESLTQMMLVTDFHPLGSLYDYLRADFPLSLSEALQLAFTTASGLEHLHNPVRGTGGRRKPEIAHRDIKSKNVLVKRAGVCCLADFGLAVRMEQAGQMVPARVNVQVGTKRYMAPEVLNRSLNAANFEEFKWADIYSFALLLWEILNRIEPLPVEDEAGKEAPIGRRQQQRLISQSNSSGIVSASDPHTYQFAGAIPNSFHRHHLPPIHQPEQANASAGTSSESGAGSMFSNQSKWEFMDADSNTDELDGNAKQKHQRAHQLPFQSVAPNDPSFEQMREIVCDRKIRPPIDLAWTDGAANPILRAFCALLTECWAESGRSRHTALKVKKELAALVEQSRPTASEVQKRSVL